MRAGLQNAGRGLRPPRGRINEAARAEDTLLDDVAQRDGAQVQMNLVAELLPEIVGEATALIAAAADRGSRGAACRADRLVDGKDDVGDPRLRRGMSQAVAAARPAHALDEAALAQPREELLEIGERNLLPLGDLGERDGLAAAVLGEVD